MILEWRHLHITIFSRAVGFKKGLSFTDFNFTNCCIFSLLVKYFSKILEIQIPRKLPLIWYEVVSKNSLNTVYPFNKRLYTLGLPKKKQRTKWLV